MKLTEEKINKFYCILKRRASQSFEKKQYAKALKYWEVAALTTYQFYLNFKDDEIEKGLAEFSKLIQKKTDVSPNKGTIVFYDAHSMARGGLTQQYIRAIIAVGWDMIYVTEVARSRNTFFPILRELEEAKNVKIEYVPQDITGLERVQYIYDTIVGARAGKLFMHILPTSVSAVAAFDALPAHIEKYQINFTDHAFWVGANCLDYSLEFRKYGCNLSIARRGINPSRVFLMPFYPIETDTPFEGYPFDRGGKIIVFSGGAYYKVTDENDSYFKLCKTVLSIDQRIVIVYAGYGDENLMRRKLYEYGLSDRFFLLGFRKDISSIYDNCDIYLDTSPHTGGLMCQYAARHGVPILSFNGWSVEDLVCQVDWVQISSKSMEDFERRAKMLILDDKKRKEEGAKLARSCITTEQFNKAFKTTIESKINQFSYEIDDSFIELNCDRAAKIKFEKETRSFARSFVKRFGISNSLLKYPSFIFLSVFILMKENRILPVIRKYFR